MKGLENKQPKIVAACTMVLRRIIRYGLYYLVNIYYGYFNTIVSYSEFGGKIFLLKPIVKCLPKLLDHSDKTVREEVNEDTIH